MWIYGSIFLNKNTAHRFYTQPCVYAVSEWDSMSLLYHGGMKQADYIIDLRLGKMSDYNSDKTITSKDTSLKLSFKKIHGQEDRKWMHYMELNSIKHLKYTQRKCCKKKCLKQHFLCTFLVMEINYFLIGILIDRGQELINRSVPPQNQEIVQTKTKASF